VSTHSRWAIFWQIYLLTDNAKNLKNERRKTIQARYVNCYKRDAPLVSYDLGYERGEMSRCADLPLTPADCHELSCHSETYSHAGRGQFMLATEREGQQCFISHRNATMPTIMQVHGNTTNCKRAGFPVPFAHPSPVDRHKIAIYRYIK
jgi:hypothetical protein